MTLSAVTPSLNAMGIFILPYCLRRVGENRYVIVNRNYKMLGTISTEWQDYVATGPVFDLRITHSIARRLSCKKLPDLDHIHLYAGWNICEDVKGWDAYCKRLSRLSAMFPQLGVGDGGRGRVGEKSPPTPQGER